MRPRAARPPPDSALTRPTPVPGVRFVVRRHATLVLLALLALLLAGCASSNYLSVRRVPRNPLAESLQLLSSGGPKPSARTAYVLRRYALDKKQVTQPDLVLGKLQDMLAREGDADRTYAFAELAYIRGKRAQATGDSATAVHLYGASVAHSYLYLFAPELDVSRNPYDPLFRQACDLYNAALEDLLRIVNREGRLRPGEALPIQAGDQRFDLRIVARGRWREGDLERFKFVSDYEVKGLTNQHVTFGIGVPLIAERGAGPAQDIAEQFYPRGLSYPVTAVLHAAEQPCLRGQHRPVACTLELCDPVTTDHVPIFERLVPLQTDLTTPLGYFLDRPEFKSRNRPTWALLNPNKAAELRGVIMLEAFDRNKIPLLMVHGLWSSPDTWTEMINDLRSLPEIRNRYQFWTYVYPTGQPFWISATQLRADLQSVRDTVDPQRQAGALNEMVLVGHSMGGLLARMQTLDSRDDFWRLLTDRPFEELKATPEVRAQLVQTIFFRPNPSVRRVITIGTPHGGSSFSNDYTRWLGRKLIRLPTMLLQAKTQLIAENPGFFRNTDLLTVTTSIDSLSPQSPVLPAVLHAARPPFTRYHNIVGVVSKQEWLGKISRDGDGVVSADSARLEGAASEIVVEADHVHVHQHPLTVWEVRRILLEHSAEMYVEASQRTALPASGPLTPPLPNFGVAPPPETIWPPSPP